MPAMPRPNKKAKEIAYNLLGMPNCLADQEIKKKKKTAIDVEYTEKEVKNI